MPGWSSGRTRWSSGEDVQRREQERHLRCNVRGQVQLAALQDQFAAQQAELKRAADHGEYLAADAQAVPRAMGAQRRVDPDEDDEEQ